MPPVRRIEVGGTGPEDAVVDAAGRVLTGLADGRILRIEPDSGSLQTVADTGGRPLGIELLPDASLLVCDAVRGLLRVDPATGQVDVLATEVDGKALVFCNNAAVATDGTAYFTDSSQRFGIEHWKAEILEHSGTGRLLRRDPDGATTTLLERLEFANGVALAPDESFVVVAETGAYRLRRLALTGPRAGESEVFVDNLPGFPDNISTGTDGLIWVSQASPRDPVLDRAHRLHPVVRRAVWALPDRLQPQEKRTVWVLAVDLDGRVVHDLQMPGQDYFMVTGVRRHRDRLYLGSLADTAIGVVDLPTGAV